MAQKRMFTMKIVDSDAFLDMPLSTQALYFHLNMRADDDGFVGNPKRIMRTIGCHEDDLKMLILKRFILTFEDGVIVIKHWRMHNCISQNRYHETQYTDEKSQLLLKENKSYSKTHGVPLDDRGIIEAQGTAVPALPGGECDEEGNTGKEEIIILLTLRNSGRSTLKQPIKGRDIKSIRHVSTMDFLQKSY